jgi:hypothetical protein
MKDFAKSYDQLKWSYAAATHARRKHYLKLLDDIGSKSPLAFRLKAETLAAIAELELLYPQLKD